MGRRAQNAEERRAYQREYYQVRKRRERVRLARLRHDLHTWRSVCGNKEFYKPEPNPAEPLILAALAAEAPNVAPLLRRNLYPDAARLLIDVCQPLHDSDLVPAIIAPFRVAPLRVALAFGIVTDNNHSKARPPDYAINRLRARAALDEAARVALATLGEPFTPWCAAPRRERAGWLLGELIRTAYRPP